MGEDWRIGRADTDAGRADARAVREAVFVEEQGVSPDIEYDEYDEGDRATHFVAYRDGDPVGAARLREYEQADVSTAKVERVAVLERERGAGLGRAIMERVHAVARERGHERAHVEAQVRVRGFYEALDYAVVGDEYEQAGIPHVPMERRL
jgi:predicted GNAT family N-acyltransferase